MDSLPKSHYGRFVHPGLFPDESLDIIAPSKIHESCRLIINILIKRQRTGGVQAALSPRAPGKGFKLLLDFLPNGV